MSGFSRRSFLKRGACAGCGTAAAILMPRFSFAESVGNEGSFDYLINILLVGGVDGTYALPPRDSAVFDALKARRPTIMGGADLNNVAQVLGNQAIGLHPLWKETTQGTLPSVFDLYQENSVAILSKIGFIDDAAPTKSHNIARGQWSAGTHALTGANSATWYSRLMNHYQFESTQVWNFGGQTFGLLPSGNVLPISVNALSDLAYHTPQNPELAAEAERIRAAILDMQHLEEGLPVYGQKLRSSIEQIKGLVEEAATIRSHAVGQGYGNNPFGRMCQDICRIIQQYKAQPGRKLIFNIELGGFDSHANLLSSLPKKIQILNDTLAALAADLKTHGLWNRTAISCLSEFGRRIYENGENGSAGTDHGRGNILMVLGGSVRGTKNFGLRGEVPALQEISSAENLGVGYDMRQLLCELIGGLGFDPGPIVDFAPAPYTLFT